MDDLLTRPLSIKLWNKHASRGDTVYIVDRHSLEEGIVECEIVVAYRKSSPEEKVCIWIMEKKQLAEPKVNSCIAQAYFLDSSMRDHWAETVFFRRSRAREAFRLFKRDQAEQEDQKVQRINQQIAELVEQKNKILDRITKDVNP